MTKKKIFMVVVLIAFVAILGITFANINNTAVQKLDQSNTRVANSSTEVKEEKEKTTQKASDMIVITDRFFIEATNDVFYNMNDYLGKKIKMEGLIYTYGDENEIYYAVVRNTPGCCGSDGLAGLDIRYEGEYPKENKWVEVIGVVDKEVVFGDEIPVIKVTSLVEKEEGKTFVTN
ncbi:MAG: hypothetical protein IJ223_05275 [Clostridia bacterium]|nr:hypothetical protein [Clostridia bacterium]